MERGGGVTRSHGILLACPAVTAAGPGIATISARHGTTLEVCYRDLALGEPPDTPLVLQAPAERAMMAGWTTGKPY